MKANEALNITEQALNRKSLIEKMYGLIKQEAEKGQRKVHFYSPLSHADQEELRSNGYEVVSNFDRNEILITISW